MVDPWQTEEWKQNRAKKLVSQKEKFGFNFCEKCHIKDGDWVIQHPHHIIKSKYFATINVLDDKYKKGLELSPDEFIQRNCVSRPSCPKCKSLNIGERKSIAPKFKCYSCHFAFEEPLLKFGGRDSSNSRIEYRRKLIDKYRLEIEAEDLRIAAETRAKYISLEGAKIYCRSCAYIEDKHIINKSI